MTDIPLLKLYIYMSTSNNEYGSHYGRPHSLSKQPIGQTTLGFLVNNDVGGYLHQQENIAQRSRHGLFSQPMGLANGDTYHDKKRITHIIQLTQCPRMWQSIIDSYRKWVLNYLRRWVRPTSATSIRTNFDKINSIKKKRRTFQSTIMLSWQAASRN